MKRMTIRRALIGLTAALALLATGAVYAASEGDIWSHLTYGATLVKVSREHRTVFTWDLSSTVYVLDLDDPGGSAYAVTLADPTWEGFQAFVVDQ